MFLSAVAVSREAPAAQRRRQPVYTHVASAGLALIAVALIVAMTVALVSGVTIGPFEVIATVLPLVAAPLVWRYGRWATVVGLVVTLLVGGGLFFIAFGLTHPASLGDFVPATGFVLGVVLALVGSIAALVQRRRDNLTAGPSRRERHIIVGAAAVVLLAVAVSTVLTVTGATAVAAPADALPVTMTDFEFAEGRYTVPAGAAATLLVHNSDGFAHDIMIPDLGIDALTVLPGRDVVVDVPAAASGTYTVYCSLHSNTSEPDPQAAGMAATLVVD